MRKRLGTWTAGLAFFCVFIPMMLHAGESSFKEYVHEGYPPLEREEYIILDVKEKDLREVLMAISRKVGVNIVADPQVAEKISITLDRVDWRNALRLIAQQAKCRVVEVSDRLIRFTQPPVISMEFQDADLKVVLDLLAKQSGANIIIANDVQGKVSLSLREVPWEDALTTIVECAGFVLVTDELASTGGKIIRVVRPESLTKQLETCWIQLRYVRPDNEYEALITDIHGQARSSLTDDKGKAIMIEEKEDGEEFSLLKALKEILSEHGRIQYDRKTNSLYIKDVKNRIEEIREIVSKIDREPPQVHVKVKFIVTSNVDLLETGIRFVDSSTGERRGANASFQGAAPNPNLFIPASRNEVTDAAGATSYVDYPNSITDKLLYWGGTFPFDLGHLGNPDRAFHALGLLDLTETKLMMEFIEDDDASRVIQSPELTTLDGQSATIFVGEAVPFAEQAVSYDQNGNATITIKENERSPVNIGFTLFLKPNVIVGTDDINLSLIPKISTLTGKSSPLPGFERFIFGQTYIDLPREQAQTIVSNMRVKHGHTALLGGLQTEKRISIHTRVPLLSSIPILGNLFTYKKEQNTNENVLIMITPSIIENTDMAEKIAKMSLERAQRTDLFHQRAIKDGVIKKDRDN